MLGGTEGHFIVAIPPLINQFAVLILMPSLAEVDDFGLVHLHECEYVLLELKILGKRVFACCLFKNLDIRLKKPLAGRACDVLLQNFHVSQGQRIELDWGGGQKGLLFESHDYQVEQFIHGGVIELHDGGVGKFAEELFERVDVQGLLGDEHRLDEIFLEDSRY